MKLGTVYRAFDAEGHALYVGMTTNLTNRLRDHARKSAWWLLHARIEHDPPRPLPEAFKSECDQIVQLRPRFNRNAGVAQWHGPVEITAEVVSEWRRLYEAGATIEQIALQAGTGANTVGPVLREAGTRMRRPGQRAGTVAENRANARVADSGPVIHLAFSGPSAVHRRRGRKRAA